MKLGDKGNGASAKIHASPNPYHVADGDGVGRRSSSFTSKSAYVFYFCRGLARQTCILFIRLKNFSNKPYGNINGFTKDKSNFWAFIFPSNYFRITILNKHVLHGLSEKVNQLQ